MKTNKEVYRSVLHKGCDGEITILSNGVNLKLACKKCLDTWDISIPFFGIKNVSGILNEDMFLLEEKE